MENLKGFMKSLILCLFLTTLISRSWNRNKPRQILMWSPSPFLRGIQSTFDMPKVEYPKPEKRADPVRAYKAARIILVPENRWKMGARFISQNGVMYAQTDTSIHYGEYSNPHNFKLDCTCGFYGCETVKDVHYSGCLLEVDLYGTVIQGSDKRYRASKQRVISVTLPVMCEDGDCDNPAEAIAIAGCALYIVCRNHISREYSILAPEILAGLLGCEVIMPPTLGKLQPSTLINVPVNVSANSGPADLSLPAELKDTIAENIRWMMHVQITKNMSEGIRAEFIGDNTGSGFFLELTSYSGWTIGRWHFQCPR